MSTERLRYAELCAKDASAASKSGRVIGAPAATSASTTARRFAVYC